MFKLHKELGGPALLTLISLAFAVELGLRGLDYSWAAAVPLILPGLAAYGLIGLAAFWVFGLAAKALRLPLPKMIGFWLGLSVILGLEALVWAADHFGGLPLLSGARLTATLAGLVLALVVALGLVYGLSRLADTALGRPIKAVGYLLGWAVIPLGVAAIVLSPWLGWFEDEYSPKDQAQPAASKAAPGPNLILISIDALRADALPAYGNKLVKTPNIDRLLAEGRLFTNLRSSAPLTLPSHSAMLTGVHPAELGIISNRGKLPARAYTLARVLDQAGLATGAVVSSPVLDPETGLARDFKAYLAPYPHFNKAFHLLLKMSLGRVATRLWGRIRTLSNAQTTSYALGLLTRLKDRRFFLFIHYWGVHDPYRPPWRFYLSAKRSDGIIERFSAAGCYRGELLYMDEQLGLLFDKLKAWGLWNKTAVILTADHGEGLGEHGYMYHAREVYEEQLRVPLIIKPAGAGKGPVTREPVTVQNMVIAPLGLALLGLRREPDLEDTPAWAVSSRALKGALIQGNRKLIVDLTGQGWQAFDLSRDPDEKNNLARPKPPWPELAAQLTEWMRQVAAQGREEVSKERERNLKALGYM